MERRLREKIKEKDSEELLMTIKGEGILAIEAAKEVLKRGGLSEKHLRAILLNIKPTKLTEEEVARIKNEAARIIIDKNFLDKRSFIAILEEVKSQEIREMATSNYFSKEGISNYVLKRIIEHVPTFREKATRRLFKQNPSRDDLLEAIEYTEGGLQKEILKVLFKKGLPIEDAIWLIEFHENLAEIVWEKLRKDKIIGKLCPDDLCEILHYTDSQKIREEAKNELLNWRDLTVENLKFIVDALESKSVKRDPKTLKEIMERLDSLRSEIERKITWEWEEERIWEEELVLIGKLREKIK
ncbi:MAG: hypothetical protein QMC93_02310, partial [Patescibacteria group bacterium]|nr:hypothetical protein [Patescibacteria group bacterium]